MIGKVDGKESSIGINGRCIAGIGIPIRVYKL